MSLLPFVWLLLGFVLGLVTVLFYNLVRYLKSDRYIHDRDVAWLLEADVLVAEVTNPSLGVGYEISKAADNGKRVLCLYRPSKGKKLSAMIAGCSKVENREYNNLKEAREHIDDFFN